MTSYLASHKTDHIGTQFSVLMSVYSGEKPAHLAQALHSLCESVVPIPELVLVEDGPLTPHLSAVIDQFRERLSIRSVVRPVATGLGSALNEGLTACSYEWVARFDTDDMIVADRFSLQLDYVKKHPWIDLCGGWIEEFQCHPGDQGQRIRRVPITHADILDYAHVRNPFNHMTVFFRRVSAIQAGGYGKEHLFEDYALWVRMLQHGCQTANLPNILAHVRAGDNMLARRGGWTYLRSEMALHWGFYRSGFIGPGRLLMTALTRWPVRLAPIWLRGLIYKWCLRR